MLLFDGVTKLGMMSVWILSPALRGLECPSSESVGRRRREVSRARFERSLCVVELGGGGEGAIVLDLKIAAVLKVWHNGEVSALCFAFSSFTRAAPILFHCAGE